jgi:hypothetical protein
LDGKSIYGAATWGDDEPPPEYAILRETASRLIKEKRLGCLLTIHSWQAQQDHSGLETIRSAGENRLSDERAAWAEATLDRLISLVPQGKTYFPDKIWHPGLARDYLLKEYNTISFRIEVTTYNQGLAGFHQTGQHLLKNILGITDWGPVSP